MPRFDMRRIEAARFQAGIDRGERISDRMMAEAIGVNTRVVWSWRNGRTKNPSPDLVRKLAEYLGVDVMFFVAEDVEKEAEEMQTAPPDPLGEPVRAVA